MKKSNKSSIRDAVPFIVFIVAFTSFCTYFLVARYMRQRKIERAEILAQQREREHQKPYCERVQCTFKGNGKDCVQDGYVAVDTVKDVVDGSVWLVSVKKGSEQLYERDKGLVSLRVE